MYCNGRNTFFGVDCIFVENQIGINIYPIDDKDIKQIFRYIRSVDFPLEYDSHVYHCTI